METLIWLVVLVVVAGLVYWIMTLLPIPQPFKNIVLVLLGLILVLYILGAMTGYWHTPVVVRR